MIPLRPQRSDAGCSGALRPVTASAAAASGNITYAHMQVRGTVCEQSIGDQSSIECQEMHPDNPVLVELHWRMARRGECASHAAECGCGR